MEKGETIMKKALLNKEERKIEKALLKGEYHPVSGIEFDSIVQAVAQRKKDAVLNIRINSQDLKQLKRKSKHLGIPYQTFVSEILHRFAA